MVNEHHANEDVASWLTIGVERTGNRIVHLVQSRLPDTRDAWDFYGNKLGSSSEAGKPRIQSVKCGLLAHNLA